MKEIIIHPEFNPFDFENDFAILKLVKLVTISRKADIINLPSETLSNLCGHSVHLFGWGKNENDSISSKLKSIEMEVLTNLDCQNTFEVSRRRISALTKNHICALRKQKGTATCYGDAGGTFCKLHFHDKRFNFIIIIFLKEDLFMKKATKNISSEF